MSITGFRIYYLEDEKNEFDLLRSGLELNNHFFPVESNWKSEMQIVHKFLVKGNDSDDKGKELVNIFKQYQPDVFILDYYLVGNEGVSTTIYKELLQTDPLLRNIPVIFLTVHMNKGDIALGTNSSYVVKNNPSTTENLPDLLKRLETEFWKYEAMRSISQTGLPVPKFSEWIRNNF